MNSILKQGKTLENSDLKSMTITELAQVFAFCVVQYGEHARTWIVLDELKRRDGLSDDLIALRRRVADLEDELDMYEDDLEDNFFDDEVEDEG